MRNDHLDARPGNIGPVLDHLRIALADDENHRRGVRRGIVREFLRPVLGDQPLVGQKLDIVGLIHGHHVGLQTVGDSPHLLGRTAVRLLQFNALARFRLPVFLEHRVVILVHVAGDVVGSIQQGRVGQRGTCHQRQQNGNNGFTEMGHGSPRRTMNANLSDPLITTKMKCEFTYSSKQIHLALVSPPSADKTIRQPCEGL